MKKIWVAVGLVALFVCVVVVLSLVRIDDSGTYDDFRIDYGYEIISADYDIDVSNDHSATVVEEIEVRFNVPSRGIIRWLPTTSGEQYYDVSVEGDVFYVTSEDGFIGIYTGDDYYYAYKGGDVHTYTISYKVVPPVRTIDNTNYYMNVVPFGWTTNQRNVTLTMRFPYEVKDILVYKGKYGTTQNTNDYVLDGNTLSMSFDLLEAFNGVTVDAELGRKFNVNFSVGGFASIMLILVLVAVALIVKLILLKDRRVFPIVNSKPPKDGDNEIDPAQMGYLIDGNCESTDITAMIFYFASKKLIRIEDNGDGEIKLHKCGELDKSAPKHQKILFEGLFSGNDLFDEAELKGDETPDGAPKRGKVTSIDKLSQDFYVRVASASSVIKNSYSNLYEKGVKTASNFIAVFGIALAVLMCVLLGLRVHYTVILNGLIIPLIITVLFPIIGTVAGKYIFNYKHKLKESKLIFNCALIGVVIILSSLIGAAFIYSGIMPFYARAVLLAGLASFGFICGLINRKTERYVTLMNEIAGFKQYLETAEKSELETMLEENPSYYYDILPYANVLGVSEKWEEKFEKIAEVPPPDYYYGPSVLDFVLLNSMIRSSFISFNSKMIRGNGTPHGGGFGGGGFGGFGGFGGGFGGGGFGGGGGGRR